MKAIQPKRGALRRTTVIAASWHAACALAVTGRASRQQQHDKRQRAPRDSGGPVTVRVRHITGQ